MFYQLTYHISLSFMSICVCSSATDNNTLVLYTIFYSTPLSIASHSYYSFYSALWAHTYLLNPFIIDHRSSISSSSCCFSFLEQSSPIIETSDSSSLGWKFTGSCVGSLEWKALLTPHISLAPFPWCWTLLSNPISMSKCS